MERFKNSKNKVFSTSKIIPLFTKYLLNTQNVEDVVLLLFYTFRKSTLLVTFQDIKNFNPVFIETYYYNDGGQNLP